MIEKKKIDGCTLGEYIKSIRKNKNLTIEQLAQRANLSTGYISKIEKDRNKKSYNITTLKQLAIALNIDTNKILQYVGFNDNTTQEVDDENVLIAYLKGHKYTDESIKEIMNYIKYTKYKQDQCLTK